MPVISAPDIVVGIAATRAPVTAATAFATSITRPPPRATSGRDADARRAASAASSGTWPGATSCTAAAAAASSAASASARGVLSSSKGAKPCSTQQLRRLSDPVAAEDDRAAGVAPDEVAVHSPSRVRGFLDRSQVRFDLAAQVLVVGRQRELLAEVLERLVDGEARAHRGDLEEDAAGLAEVDRLEVEAVDLRRRLGAGRDRLLAPLHVLLERRGPGDVVDAAGALQAALGRRLVEEVAAAALLAARLPGPRRPRSNSSASSRPLLASGAAL